MKKYVFISNSTKPTKEERRERENIRLTNVSRPCVKAAKELGYEVYLGVNKWRPEELSSELGVHLYDQHVYRSLTDLKSNWIAYKNLMSIIKEGEVEVIHCNTPIGGMLGRIAGKRGKVKKVLYTAHGFHFYKGCPWKNSVLYKTAERVMAHWTDVIITMNQEDYEAAKQFRLKNGGHVYFVHGVGIACEEYEHIESARKADLKKRKELGLGKEDFCCIAMGDLVKRKDYETSIRAIARLNSEKVHLLVCGVGPEDEPLRNLAKQLRIEKQIHFLGFRSDIKELLLAADALLFTSLQEGLPRSVMEAMASGLPCIVSKIRGNVDLIKQGKGGYLCKEKDPDAFADAIRKLWNNEALRDAMGSYNLGQIKAYDCSVVEREMQEIYQKELVL